MTETIEANKPQLLWPDDVTDVPKEVFVRDDIFHAEIKEIFHGPYWHPVAHEAEFPKKGDFKTFELGHVPLLIARGDDDVVRVFINACPHRGNQVETAPCGTAKGFECPYHRWSFKNDGALMNAPGSDDFSPKFTKEGYGLKQLKTQNVFGLILVTLHDNPIDIDQYLGRTKQTLEAQLGHEGGLRLLGYQKVQYATNWKAYMDNDGYHAPLLHTGFRLLGWQTGSGTQYITEFSGGAESQLKPGKSSGVLNDGSLIEFKDAEWNAGSFVCGVFPITIIVKHMDSISIRFAIARDTEVTEVHYAYFAKNSDSEDMAKHRTRQASNLLGPCGMISMEDAAIFQRIQIGSHSPGVATFQKGVKDLRTFNTEFYQNDETPNIPRWETYRKMMGFLKRGEQA